VTGDSPEKKTILFNVANDLIQFHLTWYNQVTRSQV